MKNGYGKVILLFWYQLKRPEKNKIKIHFFFNISITSEDVLNFKSYKYDFTNAELLAVALLILDTVYILYYYSKVTIITELTTMGPQEKKALVSLIMRISYQPCLTP